MLDIRDVAVMSTSSDEIEELPASWLESDEPTVAEPAGEETTIDVYDELEEDDPSVDRELTDLVASLTAELCNRPRSPRRRRANGRR